MKSVTQARCVTWVVLASMAASLVHADAYSWHQHRSLLSGESTDRKRTADPSYNDSLAFNPRLINSLEVAEDFNTELRMFRSVQTPPKAPAPAQGEKPESSPRYQWLKSLRNIFNGDPVASAEELSGDAERTPYIVVFKNSSSVDELRGICMQYGIYVKSNMNCNMPEVCRRVYSSTFKGFSGFFTQGQLQKLLSCFEDSVDYVEKDGHVYKMEDEQRVSSYGFTGDAAQLAGIHSEGAPVGKEMRGIGESFEARLLSGGSEEAGLGSPSRVTAFGSGKTQDLNVALWNLDRIDQRRLPLDKKFHFEGLKKDDGTGRGVTIYTVDSGLRKTHQEFKGWDGKGNRAAHGWDFVDDDPDAEDCDGHGTHVAGTAVGRTTGVAKSAKIVAVRVLDCSGSGSVSDVVAGLDWVAKNHQKPAIVTMSLGVGLGHWSRALEEAVKNLVDDYGISVIVASGNSGVDSCYVAPGNVKQSITVAASDLTTKFGRTSLSDKESLYRWSNTGECIDIFAPGVDIYSACGGESRCDAVSDTAYAWASGTSMAVPLVAGVAATYLAEYPNASPDEVKRAILGEASTDLLSSPYMKRGSPNRLLYSKILRPSTPRTTNIDDRARNSRGRN